MVDLPGPPPGMGMPDPEQMKRITIRQVGLDIFKYASVSVMGKGDDINWDQQEVWFRSLAKQSMLAAKAFTDIIDEEIAAQAPPPAEDGPGSIVVE